MQKWVVHSLTRLVIYIYMLIEKCVFHWDIFNDNDNDNENKFIAKVVQRKALQNAVHGIHIITDKNKHIEESTLKMGAEVELMYPKFI